MSLSPTKGTSVIRLWHRVGMFRMLAVALLVLGVVGGIYLSADRQTQQREIKAAEVAFNQQDEVRELRLLAADRDRALAASRSAQREAQSRADEAAAAAAAQAKKAAEEAAKNKPGNGTKPGNPKPPDFGPIPESCNQYSGNRAIGCALLLERGFDLKQMPCLDKLWTKESGWNATAANRSSGAYGIPQALPREKMSKYGADYLTNPKPQILWGLDYIKGRYTDPCGAYSFFQSKGYY